MHQYPIFHFPEIIREAIIEVASITKAPYPLVSASALTAASLCTQSNFCVEKPTGTRSPCSLYLITIAESGERKTTCDNLFTAQIIAHANKIAEQHSQYIQAFKSELDLWTTKKKLLNKQLEKTINQNKPTTELEDQIKRHFLSIPKEPQPLFSIINDATTEALTKHLSTPGTSIGLISDEGGLLLGSRAMSKTAVLNKLWESGSISISRATNGDSTIQDVELTIGLMVQPKTFDQFIAKNNGLVRDNGFLARSLICRPQSTQGQRHVNGLTPHWDKLINFRNSIQCFLDKTGDPKTQKKVLRFSDEGTACWLDFINGVEINLAPNQYLSDVKDFASKIGDQCARIAAIFQAITTDGDLIEGENVRRSIEICKWYLTETKRLFGCEHEAAPEFADATLLENWFKARLRLHPGHTDFNKRFISQYGPNALRSNKIRRDVAIEILASRQVLWLMQSGDPKQRSIFVRLNTHHFNGSLQYQNHVLSKF